MAGGKFGKKGGKKKSKTLKRKRSSRWDDEVPSSKRSHMDGEDFSDDDQPKGRMQSMSSQWAKDRRERINRKRQQRAQSQQMKDQQRDKYLELKQKQANAVHFKASKPKKKAEKPVQNVKKDESSSDDSDSDVETSKQSTFDAFMQTFAAPKEEAKEESSYNQVLDSESEVEAEGEGSDDEQEEVEEQSDAEVEEEVEEVEEESAEDPYRSRFLVASMTEDDSKELPEKAKYTTIPSESESGEKLHNASNKYEVSFRPGCRQSSPSPLPLLRIRQKLLSAWKEKQIDPSSMWPRDSMEMGLLQHLSSYQDLFFAGQTYDNTQSLRRMSVMHTLNHIFKARGTILRHNEQLRKQEEEKEFRDQGFCRSTVLVLLPLRSSALSYMKLLMEYLPSSITQFPHRDRFLEDFGSKEMESNGEKEWQKVFSEGNNDDCFQLGVSFSRRSMRFYAEYHQADLIIASPLGLRQQIGDELPELDDQEDTSRTLSTDILSSIEVCVVDTATLQLMQNVEHLRHVLQALNVRPTEAPDADFSRIREWNLAFLGAYFRQTIMFAHGVDPSLQHLMSNPRYVKNMSGGLRYVRTYNVEDGSAAISGVVPKAKQLFQRIQTEDGTPVNVKNEADARFEYFSKHVFSKLLDKPRHRVAIVVPSYLDFVRVRNLANEEMNRKILKCLQCCEYTTNKQVSRARTAFFHKKCHVLLLTERFHFYHQYHLRGIQQLIWYAPPTVGSFYTEFLNMLGDVHQRGGEDSDSEEEEEGGLTSVALFTRFDLQKLRRVVGDDRASRMCKKSGKGTYLFQ